MTQIQQQNQKTPVTLKSMLSNDSIKNRFSELLGKKAPGFISSIINVTQSNSLLAKADPKTIISSAVIAASLDLPIDKNLGFAWIVPYKGQAQFQMGYKGFTQLALRTGQYHKLNVIEVYENQFSSFNTMTEELDADFTIQGTGKVVGYACYFKLVNGFEKTTYWSVDKVNAHGKRYSKSFGNGPWSTDFDEMAKKTVLKNTLSKWGIMSIEMQKATVSDQAVIHEESDGSEQVEYLDNYSDVEIIEEQDKIKSDEKVNKIIGDLEKVKTKKEQEQKQSLHLNKIKFKSEDEARLFFIDQGIMPIAVEGKNLYSVAKDMDFDIEIEKESFTNEN